MLFFASSLLCHNDACCKYTLYAACDQKDVSQVISNPSMSFLPHKFSCLSTKPNCFRSFAVCFVLFQRRWASFFFPARNFCFGPLCLFGFSFLAFFPSSPPFLFSSFCFIPRRASPPPLFLLCLPPTDSADSDLELSMVRHQPEGLDQLQAQTQFTRKELQSLYRGFKNVWLW